MNNIGVVPKKAWTLQGGLAASANQQAATLAPGAVPRA